MPAAPAVPVVLADKGVVTPMARPDVFGSADTGADAGMGAGDATVAEPGGPDTSTGTDVADDSTESESPEVDNAGSIGGGELENGGGGGGSSVGCGGGASKASAPPFTLASMPTDGECARC